MQMQRPRDPSSRSPVLFRRREDTVERSISFPHSGQTSGMPSILTDESCGSGLNAGCPGLSRSSEVPIDPTVRAPFDKLRANLRSSSHA